MEALFWLSVFLVAYPYLVYPAVVWLIGLAAPRPARRADHEPAVTVLVPAYNEAECIAGTLEHLLAQDYPAAKLQIIVISDGSDDGTDDIVRAHAKRGVELLRQEGRGGKALALNAGVRRARGGIIVFCDANARFAPDAVRQMARNFADPAVGYVTGRLALLSSGQTVSGGGGSAYLRYENLVRSLESRVASVIGVNGGVDAIRRELYSDVSRELITDFVLPLRVIASGHRVVYDPRVQSAEHANAELGSEFRMRVRVALRALQGLVHMRQLFNPLRHPWAAFALTSHKLLRYMGFVFLATAAVSNAWLAAEPGVYRVLLAVHAALYVLALLGVARAGGGALGRLASVPAYLLVSYAAFAMATAKFLRGQSMATWQPRAG
jgi:cellulose synthase/poly-beta-1,6-N-acetylglucosamine synthase-like glycosyltransferase